MCSGLEAVIAGGVGLPLDAGTQSFSKLPLHCARSWLETDTGLTVESYPSDVQAVGLNEGPAGIPHLEPAS